MYLHQPGWIQSREEGRVDLKDKGGSSRCKCKDLKVKTCKSCPGTQRQMWFTEVDAEEDEA